MRNEEESQKVIESCDLSDILQNIEDDHCDAYSLLVNEFEAFGDLVGHTIVSVPNVGKTNKKQMCRYKNSNHKFLWHWQFGKNSFVHNRLYKATRHIIAKELPGHERLSLCMQYRKKAVLSTSTYACYARKEDMIHRVNAIIVAVGRMNTLSVFDNLFMREYLKGLDPKNKPPHRLERIRLVEVLIDDAMMEFGRITKVTMK